MNTSLATQLVSPAKIIPHRIVARVCALILIAALFVPCASAQSGRTQRDRVVSSGGNTERKAQRGQSSVTGRVVYEETGEPVKGARVRLSSRRAVGPAGATVTDESGRFRFEHLAAGEYYVIATPADAPMVGAATFALPLPSGDPQRDEAAFAAARRQNEMGGSAGVEVSVDGEQDAQVEVRVPRASVGGQVSGRVTYEDGKPAPGAQLTFLNRREVNGRMVGPTRLTVLTDEHGAYRIGGLPPGDYLVSARLQEQRYIDKQGRIFGGLLIVTFYPSATSARSATPVHVDADQQLSDINITLVKRPTHTVSGTLLARRSRRPLPDFLVRLRNREDLDLPFSAGGDDRFTQTDAQGRFSFDQVMDGDYVIAVGGGGEPSSQSPRGAYITERGGPPRFNLPPRLRDTSQMPDPFARGTTRVLVEKQQEVTVAGSDVNNLAIELSEGGRVSGTITIEGEGEIPPRLIITSEMKPGERRPSAFVRPMPDGTFAISGLPEGPLSLDVIISPPQRLYVKSITANGVDIRSTPVQVGDGTEITDVRIVLSSDVATLVGRVLSQDGTPVQGATVLLVPADAAPGPMGPMSRGRLIAVTGSGGRFIIAAGPGEYRAVVWSGRPPSDGEALRALAESAPRLSLRAGERQSVELVAPGAQ